MAQDDARAGLIIKYLLADGSIVDVLEPGEDLHRGAEELMSPAKLLIDASSGRLIDVIDYR